MGISQSKGADKIIEAISQVEAGVEPAASEAYEFLRTVPDTYATAAESFKRGLASESEDIQVVCTLALGRFGRRVPWVVPTLKSNLIEDGTSPTLKGASASALANLKTIEAASVLAETIEHKLKGDPGKDSSVQHCLEMLSQLGGIAAKHEEIFHKAAKRADQTKNPVLREHSEYCYQEYTRKLAEDFRHFLQDGPGWALISLESPDLGQVDLASKEVLSSLRKWDVRIDNHFSIPLPSIAGIEEAPKDVQELMSLGQHLQGRLVVLTNRRGQAAMIACQDHFTFGSMINKIENVAAYVSESLGLDPERIHWFTYSRREKPHPLDGELNPVRLRVSDGQILDGASWDTEAAAQRIMGKDFDALKKRLTNDPLTLESFPEFIAGLRLDQEIRERYEHQRSQSPEGRVQYNDLPKALGPEVKKILGGAELNFEGDPLGDGYGDSLDSDFLEVSDPSGLHYLITEALHSANTAGYSMPLAGELIGKDKDKIEFPKDVPLDSNALAIDPVTAEVVLLREVDPESGNLRLLTNVPRITHSGSVGYEWGYSGGGPRELAINILNHFVPPQSDGLAEVEEVKSYWPPTLRTFSSYTAASLSREFTQEVLSKVPRGGGIISSKRVCDWILSKVFEKK